MKRAIVCIRPSMEHQQNWGYAFKAGLERHGWKVELTPTYDPADLYVQWGVRRSDNIARAKADGAEVCICERGYVGDRKKWSSVSFGGGLNGRGVYRGPFADGSRWNEHFAHLLQPWRKDNGNGYALVMGQVQGDCSIQDIDILGFYAKAKRAFEEQGFKTAFRPHPNVAKANSRPIAEHFNRARCVVTFNSNSAVDAVLAGVPAVAMDEGSMAFEVTGHAFEMPPKPDRTPWAHALAWKQWTKEEMASGYCWDMVKEDHHGI